MHTSHDVVVIGAGVFGAWSAWHLQRAGLRVLLVDQYAPASARASSGGATRVIRMAYGPDAIYTRLAQESLRQWKALFVDLERPALLRETGVLSIATPDLHWATQSLDVLAQQGVRHEVLAADDLAQRYPQLRLPSDAWAIHEPEAGVLMARRAVRAVVEDCVHAGATLRCARIGAPGAAARLDAVQTESGERLCADQFVFACGPWLDRVLPDALAGRIFPTRQEVFYFGAAPADSRFTAPALPAWLDFACGYYGIPDLDGRGFKLAFDRHGERVDPDTQERAPTPARIAHARDFLAQRFPALAAAPLLGAEVCQYENTSNGDLVIDRHPGHDNVWIAGGGSGHGFKHGPAVGAYLVERMLRGGPLEPRFALATKTAEHKREVH
jgi:monomeric sarcosine oxidase